MRIYLASAIFCFGLLTMACAEPAGVPIEYSKACAAENDKKQIEVSGFLSDRGGVFCSNTGGGPVRCGFGLTETLTSEKISLSADIERGTSANNVEELARGYKLEDIKIHAKDGNLINFTEKVKITGKLNFVPGSDRCYITVSKIEK
jgi:hypothetical protein